MENEFRRSAQINAEDARLKRVAAGMRKESTPAESRVWELLRGKRLMGLRFKRQHALCGYIVDFYCHESRLCIELDGAPHFTVAGRERDVRRDQILESKGFRVLHFENELVLKDLESFRLNILNAIQAPSTSPPL